MVEASAAEGRGIYSCWTWYWAAFLHWHNLNRKVNIFPKGASCTNMSQLITTCSNKSYLVFICPRPNSIQYQCTMAVMSFFLQNIPYLSWSSKSHTPSILMLAITAFKVHTQKDFQSRRIENVNFQWKCVKCLSSQPDDEIDGLWFPWTTSHNKKGVFKKNSFFWNYQFCHAALPRN